jgi:hypothetical protein
MRADLLTEKTLCADLGTHSQAGLCKRVYKRVYKCVYKHVYKRAYKM